MESPFSGMFKEPANAAFTTLTLRSSVAIAATKKLHNNDKSTLIAYHFHTSDTKTRTFSSVLKDLVYQLASQSKPVSDALTGLYRTETQQTASDEELAGLFDKARESCSDTFIFLDALDESLEQDLLLDFIGELAKSLNGVHLLVTSRLHPNFVEEIQSGPYIEINLQREEVDKDIERYISDQLSTNRQLRKFSSSVQKKICSRLSKADGMYAEPLPQADVG